MPAITPGTTLHTFVEVFRKAIGDVYSQALASQWTVAIDASDEPLPPKTPVVSFQGVLSGALQGNLMIQVRGADALLLAQKLLGEPSDASAAPTRNHKEAIEKLLQQVAGLVAAELRGRFGGVQFELRSAPPAAGDGIPVSMLASEASVGSLPLKVLLSTELVASLSTASAAASSASTGPKNAAVANEPNFDLLLGVNLNLTLRFGQSIMSLRDILEMNTGSVIELDREVQKPADLLLGDKLIARGEVVIVNGNYGIRVTEVADVRQRLETI